MYCNISIWKCTGLKKPVPVQKNLYQFKKTWTGTNPNCTKGQIELQHIYYFWSIAKEKKTTQIVITNL